jgi:hypothetical protein
MVGRLTNTRLLAVAAVCTALLALAPVALGAKGGNRGGGNAGSGSSATLTLSPNPVSTWSSFSGSGCGYTVGKQVNIAVNSPYWNAGFMTGVDADGCMHFSFWVDGPGTYEVKAMQNLNGNKQTVLATATLTVTD